LLQLGLTDGTETTPWNASHISLINPVTGYPGYPGAKDPGVQPTFTGYPHSIASKLLIWPVKPFGI
jgi:hypothetical protein